MEKRNQPEKHYREAEGNLESPVNTKDAHDFNKRNDSLTNDESAETDPNQVGNKASFQETEEKTEEDRFDGEIKI
jgi:hypothetical protein